MTKFENGPADKKWLSIKRLPIFLRVVVGPGGEIDALDQIGDTPEAGEKLYAYRSVPGSSSSGFVDGRDPKTGKRFGHAFTGCTYRFVEKQPHDDTMRDGAKWGKWCEENIFLENGGKGIVTVVNGESFYSGDERDDAGQLLDDPRGDA